MEFISMGLIDEFHPLSSKGNRYALTAVCMLTGFFLHTPKEQVSRGNSDSLEKSHHLSVWCLLKTTDRQWHQI